MKGYAVFVSVVLIVLFSGLSCSPSADSVNQTRTSVQPKTGRIVVGSKIDTEGGLLAQIIMQVLKKAGFDVVDKSGTGPTAIVRKAIISGEIDIYPEYTGNGAYFFNEPELDVWKDAGEAWGRVAAQDLGENNLVWLKPAPANNTWAIAIPASLSESEGIRSLADFASWINRGGKAKLIGSEEFVTSPAALPAFSKAYGFSLSSSQLVVVSSGDTAQTEKAAASGTDGVNAAMAYGTDGAIAALNLVVLADPAKVQPVYEPAPVVRKSVLDSYPQIQTLLEPVFADLDLVTLQMLNGSIVIDGRPASEVAASWLSGR